MKSIHQQPERFRALGDLALSGMLAFASDVGTISDLRTATHQHNAKS